MRTIFICAIVLVAVCAVPLQQDGEKIEEKLKILQEQLDLLQRQLAVPAANEKQEARKLLFNEWQPQKRLVAWQPMKRSIDEHQPILHAIEQQLSEVLKAGERLGISPKEVLEDLRYRNQFRR